MNSQYNLMNQLVQEQKSAWRIEKHYLNEAETDEEKAFLETLLMDKQEHIKALQDLILQSLARNAE